jgi:hypothetical protein
MRFAEKASRPTKFPVFWAAANIIRQILDLVGYLRKLALRVTWPSFGITSVFPIYLRNVRMLASQGLPMPRRWMP